MDDVEDGHDDTYEGEEESQEEEDDHCHEDALSHHRLGRIRLLLSALRGSSREGEGGRVLTGRAELVVSLRSRDIVTVLQDKLNIFPPSSTGLSTGQHAHPSPADP